MRLMSSRQLVGRGLMVWAVFTAGYGGFRLVKHDEWRWDHLLQSYAGMLIAFAVAWMINRDRRVDADASASPTD